MLGQMKDEQTLPDFEESDFWVDLKSVQMYVALKASRH
jgi:hypothetical protein